MAGANDAAQATVSRVIVAGAGNIGAGIAARLAACGRDWEVLAHDADPARSAKIAAGISPVCDLGCPWQGVTGATSSDAGTADVVVVAVGARDPVTAASAGERWVRPGGVVIVSDTMRRPTIPARIQAPPARRPLSARVTHWPLSVRSGRVERDLAEVTLAVIGVTGGGGTWTGMGDDAATATAVTVAVVRAACPHARLIATTWNEAVAWKRCHDAWRCTRIAAANELARLYGRRAWELASSYDTDGRRCLAPGAPFAGPCFAEDARQLEEDARDESLGGLPLLSSVSASNEARVTEALQWVERVHRHSRVRDGHVAVVGASHRPGSADTRESLCERVAKHLATRHGAAGRTRYLDPLVAEAARREDPRTSGITWSGAVPAATIADLVSSGTTAVIVTRPLSDEEWSVVTGSELPVLLAYPRWED